MQETQQVQTWSLGREDPLEDAMATHSSILAWRIPWTEEPDGLHSIGSQSRTQLKRLTCTHIFFHVPSISSLQTFVSFNILKSNYLHPSWSVSSMMANLDWICFLDIWNPTTSSIPSAGQVFLRKLLLNTAVGEAHSRKAIKLAFIHVCSFIHSSFFPRFKLVPVSVSYLSMEISPPQNPQGMNPLLQMSLSKVTSLCFMRTSCPFP